MLRLCFVIAVSLLTSVVHGQECTELLSQAEQDYRNGLFEDIQPKICKCFGIYRDDKNQEIKPTAYNAMINEMKKADTAYAQQLGPLIGHWNDFLLSESEFKQRQNNFFSSTERNRAFVLLGKLYDQLGAIQLSEYFALKAILIEPNNEMANDSTGFNRTYSQEMERVREWSAGPSLSWIYVWPVAIKNNGGGTVDFKHQSTGRIVLGAQFKYIFNPTFAINIGVLFNATSVEYTEKRTPSGNDFDFYHTEKQNWMRIPILFQWTSRNSLGVLKNNKGKPTVKIFFATGFALDYLASAHATIVDLNSNHALYDYNVTQYRNRLNYEYILQGFARFGVGRNYLNIGLTGSYLLRDMVDQQMVGNPQNPLYSIYGIKENNYKMVTGSWMVTYDFMFNRIKKRK